MLEAWEWILGAVMILAFAFPLRAIFFRHFASIVGFTIGAIAGRVFYIYLCRFFNIDNLLIKIFVILISGALFLGAVTEFIDKVSHK
jgi:hypothetical protein